MVLRGAAYFLLNIFSILVYVLCNSLPNIGLTNHKFCFFEKEFHLIFSNVIESNHRGKNDVKINDLWGLGVRKDKTLKVSFMWLDLLKVPLEEEIVKINTINNKE